MTTRQSILRLIPWLTLISGCTTVDISHTAFDGSPATGTRIEPNQAVAVLTSDDLQSSLESEIVGCISQSINQNHPKVRVMTADEFRRTAFPYQIPTGSTKRTAYIETLLQDPATQTQLASLGIRYLILPRGGTNRAAPRLHGPMPTAIWNRTTELAALIVDVTEPRITGELTVSSSGRVAVLMFGPIPIVFPAMTETQACNSLGDAVSKFLAGEPIGPVTKKEASSDP